MFETGHLVIVSGPTAVGKSTLLNRMKQGDVPRLCDQLSIDNPTDYLYLDAQQLNSVEGKSIERLVLHYDFIQQHIDTGYLHIPDLIDSSNKVNVVTLFVSAVQLSLRIRSRIGELRSINPINTTRIKRLESKDELSKEPSQLYAVYEQWFSKLQECSVTNHLMYLNEGTEDKPAITSELKELKKILG